MKGILSIKIYIIFYWNEDFRSEMKAMIPKK